MIKSNRTKKNLLNYKKYCTVVDSDPTSTDYFRIQSIPPTLYVGKNLLKIFPNKNTLVPNSKIYIEILDSNGMPIYHEILKSTPSDNSKYIVIYVYPDTPIGDASIVIGGRARINVLTGQEIFYSTSPTSDDYKDNMNLFWSGRFAVSSTAQNNSEIFYSKDPIIDFSEKKVPYYTISSLNSNQTNLYSDPSASVSIKSIIQPFQNSADTSRYSDVFYDASKKMSIDPILNSDGTGTTRELTDIPRYSDLSTIYAQNFPFTPEMEGGLIYVNQIDLSSKTPADAIDVSLFNTPINYSSSIVKVLNSTAIQVEKPFYHKIKYVTTNGEQKEIAFSSFLNQTNVTASYYSISNLSQTPATESFVSFEIRDAEPNVGTVDKLRIKYKPIGSFGEFIDVGEFQVAEQNLFVDDSIIIQSARNGLIEKPIGFTKNQTDVNTYWQTDTTYYPGSVSLTYNASRIIESMFIQHGGINSETKYIVVTPKMEFSAKSETEYKIKFLSNTVADSSASFSPQIDIYISGSEIQTDNIKNDNNLLPIKRNSYGTYIGSVNKTTGRIHESEFFFKVIQKKAITPIFIVRSGFWNIGQIGIYPRKEIGFSPNHIKLNVPVSLFRRQVELLIHVDYLNEHGIKANTYSKIYGAYFDGSNVVVTGRDNQFTGSFSGSYGGDGRSLITSWSRIEGIPGGLISSSIDTSSFALRTEITGAFTLLSSSFTTTYLKSELTSSFVTNSQTSSFALKTEITGAFTSLSSSFVNDLTRNEFTRSFVATQQTGGFATTGSNSFVGTQNILTGSFYMNSSDFKIGRSIAYTDGNGLLYFYTGSNLSGSFPSALIIRPSGNPAGFGNDNSMRIVHTGYYGEIKESLYSPLFVRGGDQGGGLVLAGGVNSTVQLGPGLNPTGSNSAIYIDASKNIGIGTSSISASLKMDVVGKIRATNNGPALALKQSTAGSIFTGIDLVTYTDAIIGGLLANQSSGEIRLFCGSGGYYPTFFSNGSEAAKINTTGTFIINNAMTVSGSATISNGVYLPGTSSIGIGTPIWTNSTIRIITPNTASNYYMLHAANSDGTRGFTISNNGVANFGSLQNLIIPFSHGYPSSSLANRSLFYNNITQRPSFYDKPIITAKNYVTIDSTYSDAGINFPEMKNILWGINQGRWTSTTSGSNIAGSNWKINYVMSPHVYNAGLGLTYPAGTLYLSFWSGGTPATASFRMRNSSGTWFTSTTSKNLYSSGTDYFGFMKIDVGGVTNYIQEIEVQFTNSVSHATNLTRIEYMPDSSEGLLGPTPNFQKNIPEHLYNPIYGYNTSGTQSYAINSTSGWVLNNLYVTIGSASQQTGQQFFLKGRSGVSSIFKIQSSAGVERQNLTDAGSYYLTSSFNLLGDAAFSSSLVSWNGYRVLTSNDTSSFALKTEITGAFATTSGSLGNRIAVLENFSTGSFIRPSDTSSFALRTEITGAFTSLSSSFSSDYLRNELTRSFVNNSSTSSFALRTEITGAFNSISSSFVNDYLRSELTRSFVNNSSTSSFALRTEITGAFTLLSSSISSDYLRSESTSSFAIKTEITGAFNSISSSFTNDYLRNELTRSFVNNSSTSSFAIKTEITGAFNSISSSFTNDYLRNELTRSFVNNSSTSSFALKTEITGAFTTTSSSLGSRISLVENFSTGSFIRPSDTSSFALKTEITGAFTSLSSSFVNNLLRSESTSSFVNNSSTSSFAIKTSITGAFTSLSSSFVNDYPRNELTRSFVNNSSTSSFALKTDITGAFTTTSSSLGSRVTTLENKVYVSASNDSHILISNNTTTGSYTTEGLSYFKETVAAPTQSAAPWGIFKVEGERVQNGKNFGEIELAGAVAIKEDVSKIDYIYGIHVPRTSSVMYYLDFPIFKNNLTGSAYTDGRSRYGVMAVEVNVMVFASASSAQEKVFAQKWTSRFTSTALSFVQVNTATTSAYGADPGYDSYLSLATTMAAGVTVSASMLRIPCTFTAADGGSYSLKTAASCTVIKTEFL